MMFLPVSTVNTLLALYIIYVGLASSSTYNEQCDLSLDIFCLPKVKAFEKSTNIKSWCSNFMTTTSHIPQICTCVMFLNF
jgi:hypothetical protein